MNGENPRDFVRALARGLAVIESFDEVRGSASLSEIAARAQLSRGTVRRALMTLQSLGYLGEENGRFSLLPRALRLGYSYLNSQPIWALARPYVEEVHAQTGETTSVSVLDEGMIVYVIRIVASRLVHDNVAIGSRLPAYPAAMGRVLLAGLPEAELERYLRETEFKQLTSLTVIDPARLRVVIRQARQSGFAVNDQEMELGLRSIAVPITAPDGVTVAAMNIACSSVRISHVEMKRNFLPVLRAAVKKISDVLTHAGLSGPLHTRSKSTAMSPRLGAMRKSETRDGGPEFAPQHGKRRRPNSAR
jgi:IclR family transcriptional regulator, pca regulon regulatory protein